MKIPVIVLDKLILFLLSLTVLVDMINGFFIMEFVKLPVSQLFKLSVIILILLRLSNYKEIYFALLILTCLQISPLIGLLKTGNFSHYTRDVIVASKWFTVPLSFLFFKNVFQSSHIESLMPWLKRIVVFSFLFIAVNLLLGSLGLGMSFYHHGYGNAVGTKGFIYAGNELSILVLCLAFIIAIYFKERKQLRAVIYFGMIFLLFAFLITSKTVIFGVLLMFLLPWVSSIKRTIKKKWIDYLFLSSLIGTPIVIYIMYFIVINSGFLKKFESSMRRNDNDLLTVFLSNRNNFLEKGIEAFSDYAWYEKILGLGQNHFLSLAEKIPEIDFFTLLFISGLLGLVTILITIWYYFLNAMHLRKFTKYIYAKHTLIFLIFLIVIANLSGHIFGSGIAAFFIGGSTAMMFLKQ